MVLDGHATDQNLDEKKMTRFEMTSSEYKTISNKPHQYALNI